MRYPSPEKLAKLERHFFGDKSGWSFNVQIDAEFVLAVRYGMPESEAQTIYIGDEDENELDFLQ